MSDILTTQSLHASAPARFPFRPELLLSLAAFAVFAWPSLALLFSIYRSDGDYSHGLMVPVLAAFFVFTRRRRIQSLELLPSHLGIMLTGFGALLVVVGGWYNVALMPSGLGVGFLHGCGLLITILGLCLALGGLPLLRVLAFPLSYLVFAIPIPRAVTQPITIGLRDQVSFLSEALLRFAGVTVYREGNVLHLATAVLGIEDACSGIRSVWMLIAGAAAIGFVLGLDWRCGLLLCLLAIPVAVGENVLRVVVTGALASRWDTLVTGGWRHELLGAGAFVSGLVVIGCAALLLRRWRPRVLAATGSIAPPASSLPTVAIARTHWLPAVGSALVLAMGAYANTVVGRHYLHSTQEDWRSRQPFSSLPAAIGDFRQIRESSFRPAHMRELQSSDQLLRVYAVPSGAVVELSMIYWQPTRFDRAMPDFGLSGHTPDRCYPAWGFEPCADDVTEANVPAASGKPIMVRVFRKTGTEYVVLYWFKRRSTKEFPATLGERCRAVLESWRHPYVDHGSQYLVTVTVPVVDSRGSARETGVRFVELLLDQLPAVGLM